MSDSEIEYAKPERGAQMTRLETFTDAAFAFAVTLLAISIDQIPSNYPELVETLKGAPAFLASFALLILYWRGHHVWSQQYGLDDLTSVILTAVLVSLILIYVYPMKILFSLAFSSMSDGWFPSNFDLDFVSEFPSLVTIYGVGFLLLNLSISSLYFHAWRQRKALDMDSHEAFDTLAEAIAWIFVASVALLSIILVWTLPGGWASISTWVYALLFFFNPVYLAVIKRIRRRKLATASND